MEVEWVLPDSYIFLQPMHVGSNDDKRHSSRLVPLVTQHEAAPGLHTVCVPLGCGPCRMHVCLSMDIPKPLSFHAPSAGNEKQTYILGNSDSIKKKKGPKGFVADNRLNMSAYGAVVVTKGTGVIVRREGAYVALISGACAYTAGALCPATVSALQQKSCKIGSSLEKSQRDD